MTREMSEMKRDQKNNHYLNDDEHSHQMPLSSQMQQNLRLKPDIKSNVQIKDNLS